MRRFTVAGGPRAPAECSTTVCCVGGFDSLLGPETLKIDLNLRAEQLAVQRGRLSWPVYAAGWGPLVCRRGGACRHARCARVGASSRAAMQGSACQQQPPAI